METTQGNSLCYYAKPQVSFFIFYGFFYKIREQEGRTGCAGEKGEGGRVRDRMIYGANNTYTYM
jgi:hypothetical protein